MGLLVAVGRFLVGVTAIIVVLVCAAIGLSLGSNISGLGSAFGGVLGGMVGLLLAGSVFGALAALLQIATNTEAMLLLLQQADARASNVARTQSEAFGELLRTAERGAGAVEKAEARAKRLDISRSQAG